MSAPDSNYTAVEDVREILAALGLGTHARPYSAHDVVQREVLPALCALVAERDALRAAIHVVVTDLRGRSLSYVTRAKIDALARVLDDAEATP